MLEVEIIVSDISQEGRDALVNAVNNHLWIGVLLK